MQKRLIAPSILAADYANLEKAVKLVNESEADWIHCDIMDGVYVPNLTFGWPIIKRLSEIATKPLDVHLMIVNPERYIEQFKDAGATTLTIHYEACTHINATIDRIRKLGMSPGVALNPGTPVSMINEIIDKVDLVLLMSVDPGFGGQKFIPNTLNKVKDCKEILEKKNSKALIEVDGGIYYHNAKQIYDAGFNVLVMGTAIFGSPDPLNEIKKVKAL
jgi:ribulose-phosphate 3-epimerase